MLGQANLVTVLLKDESPGWRRECLQGVRLGFQGEQGLDQIAFSAGRSRSTTQEWFDAYRTGCVEVLLKDGRSDNARAPAKMTQAAQTEMVTA